MFGIGMQELLLILVIALIVLGPKKLPDVAKSLGKALNEFKRAASDIKESLDLEDGMHTVKKSFDVINDTPAAAADPSASAARPSDAASAPSSPAPEDSPPKPPEPPRASS
jgi:sec-independent protein translocase protein TatB